MKRRYQEESGFEIDEASDVAIRLRVLAGEIYNMQTTLDWTKRQFFPETATGDYLGFLARQRGLERYPAAKAKGSLTFSVNLAEYLIVIINPTCSIIIRLPS